MASLHPTHGARVVIERESITAAGARYRVAVYGPTEVHASVAELTGGGVRFDAWTSSPPEWAAIFTERLLKGLAKKHASDRGWPRKLVRWRDERE